MRSSLYENLGWAGIYVLSALTWHLAIGPSQSNNLLEYLQYPDPAWVAADPWGTLIHAHSQPPAMIVVLWLSTLLTPQHPGATFLAINFIAGIAALPAINATLAMAGASPVVRWTLLGLLCAFPTLYIVGSWHYSTHLEFAICAYMLFWVTRFVLHPSLHPNDPVYVFVCLAVLGLMRPVWHPAFLCLLAAILAFGRGRRYARRILPWSLVFLLPLGAWYTKNSVMFGFWGASSWMGANLSQAVERTVPAESIARLKQEGRIPGDYPIGFHIDVIRDHYGAQHAVPPEARATVASLSKSNGAANYNYIGVVSSSARDLRDSLTIIGHEPSSYLAGVFERILTASSQPTFRYPYFLRTPLAEHIDRLFGRYAGIVQQTLDHTAFLLYMLIPLAGVAYLFFCKSRELRTILMFSSAILAFMMFAVCAVNGWEQERMRWGWQPVYVLLAAIVLEKTLHAGRRAK